MSTKINLPRKLRKGLSDQEYVASLFKDLRGLAGGGPDIECLSSGRFAEVKTSYRRHFPDDLILTFELAGDMGNLDMPSGIEKAVRDGCDIFLYYFKHLDTLLVFNTQDLRHRSEVLFSVMDSNEANYRTNSPSKPEEQRDAPRAAMVYDIPMRYVMDIIREQIDLSRVKRGELLGWGTAILDELDHYNTIDDLIEIRDEHHRVRRKRWG